MISLPDDQPRCLAYPENRPFEKRPEWCDRYVTCLRHQAISQDPFDGSHTVKQRVCQAGQFDQFLAVDRSSDGIGS